jgi:acetaldehyde dehydrogenase
MIMRDTVFCAIPADADTDAITESIRARVAEVQRYVPGYTLRADPQYDEPRESWNGNARVAVFLEVRGGGDYLPEYAGNLDIMTAAAARVGEVIAQAITREPATGEPTSVEPTSVEPTAVEPTAVEPTRGAVRA